MEFKVLKEFTLGEVVYKEGSKINAEEFSALVAPEELSALIKDKTIVLDGEHEDPEAKLKKEEEGHAVPDDSVAADDSSDEEVSVSKGTTKTLAGKIIISETTREVNGKEYKHIRLEDGSTQDLTDEEYELQVLIQDNG